MKQTYLPLLKVIVLIVISGVASFAQNPFIRDQFTADPSARVFNGKVYVFPSHDIPTPPEKPGRKDWFCMEDYHVFSSENLTDWTDHGMIVSQYDAPWIDSASYSMWAPDCVERNGKYYFYFPANTNEVDKNGRKGFGIGVAVADQPEGPYVAQQENIKGIKGIDPNVLIDKDGQAYIYWSHGHIFVAKLKENMLELDSEPMIIPDLPEKGLKEGPWVFERNGIYYLTFPHVENNTERLEYGIGDNPMGPFKMTGVIMDESPTGCWTNHHSITEYNKQRYLFYHHNDYSPTFDKNRSVRVDSLFFNADGTIQKVQPSLRGVGLTKATNNIEIDRYSAINSSGAKINFIDTTNTFEGWKTIFESKDAWIQYNAVDFGDKKLTSVQVKALSEQGGTLQIRLNHADGPIVAEVNIPQSTEWKIVEAQISEFQSGVHHLVVVSKSDGPVEVDWVRFGNRTGAYYTGNYPNLLLEAGYSQQEIDAKLSKAYYDLFEGPNRVYFEVGDSMAYVSDIKNHDARSEGLSYGMMVAVQLDKKEVFDRIWRWTKEYSQHQGSPRDGYFAWSINPETMVKNSEGSASDGELFFVTTLLFASNRWGNDTGIDYYAEARRILDAMWAKDGTGGIHHVINLEHKQISFVPEGGGYEWTDPSYHVPAFLEFWADFANDGHEQFYRDCADTARVFLHRACHPETGLNYDYTNFDGTAHPTRWMPAGFRYDSWRVPMNIAMDYVWFGKDKAWQEDYAARIHGFLRNEGINEFVDQYNLDGTTPGFILQAGGFQKLRHSLGFISTAATVSLIGEVDPDYDFVHKLWNEKLEPYEDGYFDPYFDGFMYLFSLMNLSGKYQAIVPAE